MAKKKYGRKIARTYRFDRLTIDMIGELFRYHCGGFRAYLSRTEVVADAIREAHADLMNNLRLQEKRDALLGRSPHGARLVDLDPPPPAA